MFGLREKASCNFSAEQVGEATANLYSLGLYVFILCENSEVVFLQLHILQFEQ